MPVPLDILINHILLGLSTKCLLRCRCVCKQWLRLISAPEFTAIRIQRQRNNCRILCGPVKHRINVTEFRVDTNKLDPPYEVCYGIFYSLDIGSTPPPTLTRLPGFPVHDMKDFILVQPLGYSNGMLCMLLALTKTTNERRLFFGNPSTGSYKILPDAIDDGPMIVGFGYDSLVDDYKFVRVDNTTRNPHIYSLKSNSWATNLQSSDKHMIIHPHYWECNPQLEGCFFGDSIYWLVDNKQIIVFNLRDEEFTELPLPVDYTGDDRHMFSLKVAQNSLCIIKWFKLCIFLNTLYVDMWLLNENNHWIKLMKQVELIGATALHPLFFTDDRRILCCVEQGHIRDNWTPKNRYVRIDPQTGVSEDFTVNTPENNFFDKFYFDTDCSGYIDCLISPNQSYI